VSEAAIQPEVRFSARTMAAGSFLPPLAVGGLVGGIAAWTGTPAMVAAALIASLIVAVPALLLPGVAIATPRLSASRAPVVVVAGSAMRTVISLALGLAVYAAAQPDKLVFWGVFLGSALAALVGETAASVRSVRRATRPHASSNQAEGTE